jgi:hypothetical protein
LRVRKSHGWERKPPVWMHWLLAKFERLLGFRTGWA